MENLIKLYLKMNPNPSDEQVHALACALGMDKETLEHCMYKMLTRCVSRLLALSDIERVLDGEPVVGPDQNKMALVNDGETDSLGPETEFDLLLNDGTVSEPTDQLYTDEDGIVK